MLDSATGASTQLVVVGQDGRRRHIVERSAYPFQVPVWSPDGERIAYLRGSGADSGPAVGIVRPDGSGRHLVSRRALDQSDGPSWSPGGERLAFVGPAERDPRTLAIVVANVDR